MNNLILINRNGQLVLDSREAAPVMDIRHDNLLSKIKGFVEVLDSSNLRSQDFFIESTYFNTQNKEQPCYLLTRKGCDMVANKMTGEKGVLFTAAYVTKFEEMEKALQPKLNIDSKFLFQIAVQLEEKEKQIQIMAPKAEYVPDLFELKEFTRGDYSDNQTLVTPRGRETFRLMLIKDGLVREG